MKSKDERWGWRSSQERQGRGRAVCREQDVVVEEAGKKLGVGDGLSLICPVLPCPSLLKQSIVATVALVQNEPLDME